MKIYLAGDHAGFIYKEKVKSYLENLGYFVYDMGAMNLVGNDNYVPYMKICMEKYIKDTFSDSKKGRCIVFGGSGTGEAITCNRYKKIRAVVFNNENLEIIKMGRLHNDANVLSIGARFLNIENVYAGIDIFLKTSFEGGRHIERVLSIDY